MLYVGYVNFFDKLVCFAGIDVTTAVETVVEAETRHDTSYLRLSLWAKQ